MLLERRTVSRKTPGDGRLEISPGAAERLRSVGGALQVEVAGTSAPAVVETMACTCRKVGQAHEHHFVVSELLKSLREASEVEVRLADRAGSGGPGTTVVIQPVE